MQVPALADPPPTISPDSRRVLGTTLILDLEQFPELAWLSDYLTTLAILQSEHDRRTQSIQSIAREGEVYRDCWLEPYTKTKNGKQYIYYQLRWLTGERKKSGQPQVKTKHLSHRAVSEARAAIARGKQIEALEKQQQAVEHQIFKLKQLVRGIAKRLEYTHSQNLRPNTPQGMIHHEHY